ncbi:TetR family transcriptional regulator [Phenylobacterium sp. LH3H17]|uniref:TetR/AcrR family transcriptional regulator n=1 Tax=Phenylobacterium sp. LH3H17 TaxID=2903901 RepID=UPI0020C97D17|nr:TetR/AcrR family transcriptional regulator [Phenylobacterium sp. LH3H17]UTP40334.1 TetR family transcriptional regulator [Phenylobacterium sp. LH3H17]
MPAIGTARVEGVTEGTVDQLLSVAEQLFAERGVAQVALTHIVAQSGQKNRSAVHYHFGSRAGVLAAVMNRRLASINARREALIDALQPDAAPLDVVRAISAPLGLAVIEAPWGGDYLSILAQVTFHPQLLGERGLDNALLSGVRRGKRRLAKAAPHLPPALLDQRLTWLTDSIVFAMARWARDTPKARQTPAAMAALIEHLAAYGTAGLLAPDPTPEITP